MRVSVKLGYLFSLITERKLSFTKYRNIVFLLWNAESISCIWECAITLKTHQLT